MKTKIFVTLAIATGLLGGCATDKAGLMADAKVTKGEAEKTALARVPNGTIKESELEKENGKLQWSFDVATPDTRNITEVNIDAVTGSVISVEKEGVGERD
jgi:uncharacterized membrane protein YkoI